MFLSRSNLSLDWLARTTEVSTLDMTLRRVLVLSKLFTTSWGRPSTLKELLAFKNQVTSQRSAAEFVREMDVRMRIERDEAKHGVRVLDASFPSPYGRAFPSHMTENCSIARFRAYLPARQPRDIFIHLAPTGDHSYFRRERGLVRDLLDAGCASVLLMNPFYDARRPPNQFRSSLLNVSDLFVMGAAVITECLFILKWAEREGYESSGISGVSMGGFMACLATSNAPSAISCVPCLMSTTASPAYTEGAIRDSIPWHKLARELKDPDYVNKLRTVHSWYEEAQEKSSESGQPLEVSMMRVLMDEFTDLRHYPLPIDSSRVHGFVAEQDGYIVQKGIPSLEQVWPGCRVERLSGGHVQAFLTSHAKFRKAILESLGR